MRSNVNGTTVERRWVTRCCASYWPLQVTAKPAELQPGLEEAVASST